MNRPSQTLALAALFAVAACSEKPAPPPAPKSHLQSLMDQLPYERPCSIEIPEGWAMSKPVPVLIDGKLRYRVFFYGRSKPGPDADPRAPEGEALVAPEGKVLECRAFSEKRSKILTRGPELNMTVDEMLERRRKFYFAIEEGAKLYAAKLPLDAAQRASLAALKKEYAFMSVPAHAPDYRALNPDFWAWLDKNAAP